jgi:phenylalanyl-tRNA synthetase beta chain
MKFTLSWLKEHLDTEATVQDIADKLTALGLEVEGVENPAEKLAPFVVAEVLSAERHPQADKLQVLAVDYGQGPVQVVCGAPNARAGMKGVFGPPGAFVPGAGITLKVAAIRGVESNGMMCSERELELGTGHEGIIELPGDAPVGQPFAAYSGLEDPVFDIAVTPNRPDCLGVRGIARDLAAAGLGTLRERPVRPIEDGANPVAITIEEGSGCEAFAGRLIRGVRNGPSPDWLQRRLRAVGLRPISALVDVTNFFSVDQARPLHVYDAALLKGGINVRRGREGERFEALNDRSYEASSEDCVIADESGVIGLGGVVGGTSTGVSETTGDVLLECAWFDPQAIARTGQRHQVHTDARARFERGVDSTALKAMLDAATAMIVELCGGSPSGRSLTTTARWSEVVEPRTVALRPERVASLAGLELPAAEQARILSALGFSEGATGWTVPGWRPDIDGGRSRPGRGGRAGRRLRPTPLHSAPARAGGCQAGRASVAAPRAPLAPRRGRPRPSRGNHLELHRHGRCGPDGRRHAHPRESHQRGDEGDAAFAAARPCSRCRPQPFPRRDQHPLVRARPPLSRRRRAADPFAAARRRGEPAQLAGRQGAHVRPI